LSVWAAKIVARRIAFDLCVTGSVEVVVTETIKARARIDVLVLRCTGRIERIRAIGILSVVAEAVTVTVDVGGAAIVLRHERQNERERYQRQRRRHK